MLSGKRRLAMGRTSGRHPMRSRPNSAVSDGPCRFPRRLSPCAPKDSPPATPRLPWSRQMQCSQNPKQGVLRWQRKTGCRAIRPVHTPLDGDTVFAAATGARALLDSTWTLASLGALAADVLARAVARGVYMAASSVGLADMPPSWKDRFGG